MDFWAWLQSLFAPKPAAPVQPAAPSGATVLTLAPAGAALGLNWLRGEPFTGRTVKSVAYKNDPLNNGVANAVDGVAKLDVALHANTGSVVIVAHSMGAQVACKWLREKGPTSDIDPARVEFILTGNPERKGTGVMRNANKPWWVVAQFGGPGLPDDTRYKVTDVARAGDFWADFPHCANWLVGMAAHGDYTQVGLRNPANTSTVEGNVTYLSA